MRKCLLPPRQTVLAVRPTVKTGCEHETTKSESGTTDDECYEFATLSVVGENTKFTLAMRPCKKGEHYGEVVCDLMITTSAVGG